MNKIKVFLSNRTILANILMAAFVILTAVGAGIIFPPAGLIIAGVCCGLVGLLLGLE
jgi:hypothetical protein